MRSSVVAGTVVLASACATFAGAQIPASDVHVAVGWGVDTARTPNHDIFALWRAYLASQPVTRQSSPYWSPAEQARWHDFDLLKYVGYQGLPRITVIQLAPAQGLDSTYLIRSIEAAVVDSARDVKPIALLRVYAAREGGRWVLENALPIQTRSWRRVAIGSVTFLFPLSHRFDEAEARASAAFVDSLARALAVPVPKGISYYVADRVDDILRAWGLDFFPTAADTIWGQSLTADNIVLTAGAGERHRHELAHLILAPLMVPGRTNRLVAEGLTTWVAGSEGIPYRRLLPALRQYVDSHPELTLETVLRDPPPREGELDVGYDGVAVLCDMVNRRAGPRGIRELTTSGASPDSVLAAAARLIQLAPGELDAAWRRALGARSR